MKTLLLLLLPSIAFTSLRAEKVGPLSLPEYWKLAETHSPGLKARAKQFEAIRHSLKSLPVWYRPDVYAELGYTAAGNKDDTADGPLARFVAEWTVWDGGRTHFSRLRNEQAARAAKWRQVLATMALKRAIAVMYYETAKVEDFTAVYSDSIGHLERMRGAIRRRIRIGRAGRSDLLMIRVRKSRLKSRMIILKRMSGVLQKELALLTGKGDSRPRISAISRQEPLLAHDGKEKLKFTDLPAYKLARARIKALKAEREFAKRNLYWPALGIQLFAGYGPHIDAIQAYRPEAGIGINFRFPLFASRDRRALLSAKQAGMDAGRLNLEQSLLKARMDFSRKNERLAALRVQMAELKSAESQAKLQLKAAYREYARGLKSSGDMLTSLETSREIRGELITARKEALIIAAELFLLHQYAPAENSAQKGDKK